MQFAFDCLLDILWKSEKPRVEPSRKYDGRELLQSSAGLRGAATAFGDLATSLLDLLFEGFAHFEFVFEVVEKPVPKPAGFLARQLFDGVLDFDNGAHGRQSSSVRWAGKVSLCRPHQSAETHGPRYSGNCLAISATR